jgi:hypothetical protein
MITYISHFISNQKCKRSAEKILGAARPKLDLFKYSKLRVFRRISRKISLLLKVCDRFTNRFLFF